MCITIQALMRKSSEEMQKLTQIRSSQRKCIHVQLDLGLKTNIKLLHTKESNFLFLSSSPENDLLHHTGQIFYPFFPQTCSQEVSDKSKKPLTCSLEASNTFSGASDRMLSSSQQSQTSSERLQTDLHSYETSTQRINMGTFTKRSFCSFEKRMHRVSQKTLLCGIIKKILTSNNLLI